jgi:hypothetical protein
MKDGPIALIDETVPVVVLAPNDDLFEKTLGNVEEVMARWRPGGDDLGRGRGGPARGPPRLRDRGAALRPVRRAAPLRDPDPAPRLPRRGQQRHRRRPAAQPRQKRHGRVTRCGNERSVTFD